MARQDVACIGIVKTIMAKTLITKTVIAKKKNWTDSEVFSATYTIQQKVATPTATPDDENFGETVSVTLSCTTADADIYYTLDGSTPTKNSTKYTQALQISANTTVKAIAVKENWADSDVLTKNYANTYSIICDDCKNGSISADAETAKPGATITVTPSPDQDYIVSSVGFTKGTNAATAIEENDDAEFTFEMPAANVKVSAIFTQSNPGSYQADEFYQSDLSSTNGKVTVLGVWSKGSDVFLALDFGKSTKTVTNATIAGKTATFTQMSGITVTSGTEPTLQTKLKKTSNIWVITAANTAISNTMRITVPQIWGSCTANHRSAMPQSCQLVLA